VAVWRRAAAGGALPGARPQLSALLLLALALGACAGPTRERLGDADARQFARGDASERPEPPPSALAEALGLDEEELHGVATWYGERHHGRRTASGEPFDMHDFTAAHRTLPFGTRVRVTRLDTRQSVVVRINDRGPWRRGRIIDLSRAAAEQIELIRPGHRPVALEIVGLP
jgi:rare lipoprotein A